jgi:HEAT repeat protein
VPRFAAAIAALGFVVASGRLAAQENVPPPTPEQLAARERVRPIVEQIWKEVRAPSTDDSSHPRYFWDYTDRLIAIGPDVVPFLSAEIDLEDAQTYNIAAYALGRIGGKEAEAALRKAFRAGEARAGRFGLACKRYSIYGLGLLGKSDVVDLFQSGKVSLHASAMIPELPLIAHLSMLVGKDTAPALVKQIDTFATDTTDPAAADRLEDALLGVARVGDASIVPKLAPLLSHPSPAVRAAAAEAIARVAPPTSCDLLTPLLASKELSDRMIVAAALARWKPQPCYKAIVGRLEVENNVSVRSSLYNAVVGMGGEGALEVLRAFILSPNQFDQALVVDAIGRVGSKKGLNLLRSILPDANPNTIAHALGAMSAIGGEGAIDTIFATTNDRRRFAAFSAEEILTALGDTRVAPRRAQDLLSIVKEPVGNLTLRSRIVELCEALVTLRYTDPIDDIKSAIKVQSDPEIVDTLTSCLRRLELLVKNGNDTAAWGTSIGSDLADVRALAAQRLAEIGSPAAVRSLAGRLSLSDLPVDERVAILMAIGQAKTAGAADLIERHLSDPVFDAWVLRDARAAAAWAARRLGGDRMLRALRASCERRDGRDWAPLVYDAILDKGNAVDLLRSLRLKRLRYPEARFGREDSHLEEIILELSNGRPIARFDIPPEALSDL